MSSPLFRFILYADDSTLCCSFPRADCENVHTVINEGLSDVHGWLLSNRLAINTDKTKYIIFSYRGTVDVSPIRFGGDIIQQVDSVKFLGMHIDQNLTFSRHIDYVSSKISKTIGMIYRLNSFFPSYILRTLYFSLIHPYFIYGSVVYLNTANYLVQKLVLLQKKAIRAVYGLNYRDHTTVYFHQSKILKLQDLHKFNTCLYFYRVLNHNFDSSLLSDLNRHANVHSHNTRYNSNMLVPLYSHSKSQNCITYVGSKFWNGLTDDIRASNSIHIFKNKLKQMLISSYSPDS